MKRILPLILRAVIALLGVVLVVGIVANVAGFRAEKVLAPIATVDIWADNSSPRQYFADVASGQYAEHHFDSYSVSRAGDTIEIQVFNLYSTSKWGGRLLGPYVPVEHTIPLGANFVPGVNYTVEVNNVLTTFVA
jgi:hypothetical protein